MGRRVGSRRTSRVGVLMIALGTAVFLTPVGTAVSQLATGPDGPDALVAPENEPGALDPAGESDEGSRADLPAEDEARANELMEDDPRLQDPGRGTRIIEIGPWMDGDLRVGATVLITFDSPQSFPMSDWPQIDYGSPEGGEDPYTSSVSRFAADGVTELQVDVDLQKGQVVGISPDGPDIRITPEDRNTSNEEPPTASGY